MGIRRPPWGTQFSSLYPNPFTDLKYLIRLASSEPFLEVDSKAVLQKTSLCLWARRDPRPTAWGPPGHPVELSFLPSIRIHSQISPYSTLFRFLSGFLRSTRKQSYKKLRSV